MQVGVIPARYASQRFPGKPLALITGKPMIVRTYEQAKLATSLDALVVATDDERIAETCRAAGAQVVMTSQSCPNGELRRLMRTAVWPAAWPMLAWRGKATHRLCSGHGALGSFTLDGRHRELQCCCRHCMTDLCMSAARRSHRHSRRLRCPGVTIEAVSLCIMS